MHVGHLDGRVCQFLRQVGVMIVITRMLGERLTGFSKRFHEGIFFNA